MTGAGFQPGDCLGFVHVLHGGWRWWGGGGGLAGDIRGADRTNSAWRWVLNWFIQNMNEDDRWVHTMQE